MSARLGRFARVLGLGLLDLLKGSEERRQYLQDHRELRFYQRIELDLADARTNEEHQIYGDIIALESTTGTLSIRLNEDEADLIEFNRVRKVYSEFWRFYITNAAQVGKNATILVGRDALFDADTARAIGLVNTLGEDVDPYALAKIPYIYNVVMTLADTEYSQTLPAACTRFLIQMRENDTAFRIAFVTGKVAAPTAPYYTVQAAREYFEEGLNLRMPYNTIYFACAVAAKNIQIIAWV